MKSHFYVAKKKDKAGRIFGFVRYRNVEDVGLLEGNLKNIMVEGRRLVVNLAKYDIFGHKVEVATSINHLRSAPVGSGLPDLVSGFPPLHQNCGSNRPCLNALNGPWAKQRSVSVPPDTIAFSERYESSLVGSVIDFNTLCNIHTSIADAGFHGLGIKYLGGFVVLLTFPNSNEACVFLNKNDLWKFWFSSLDQWCGQSLPFERVAWIRVLGVPAHLWDRSVINSIGNQFGKVIQGSQISWGDNNWSQECIGILVGDGRQIKEELELTWRDNSYRVWIIEEPGEWIPDCLRPITTPKDPYAKDCYRTKSSPVDNFGTEHGTADVSSSGGPRNLVGSASEKPYGDLGKAFKCDLANKIEIQPTCISPREHSFFDSQSSKWDGEMCQLKKQVGGPIGNKRSTPSKTPGPFIFCAATSNPKGLGPNLVAQLIVAVL
ncbi:putative RNA-binding domain superfamily [Helianthus annuus]|nr:putative RNA-binding domain superfamily [Helianthus annuus]KAJ0824861.1 putative RNA-binding domain superfamily [Helianthus annuus]